MCVVYQKSILSDSILEYVPIQNSNGDTHKFTPMSFEISAVEAPKAAGYKKMVSFMI